MRAPTSHWSRPWRDACAKTASSPFLDKWHLGPGEPWQEALEALAAAGRPAAPARRVREQNEDQRQLGDQVGDGLAGALAAVLVLTCLAVASLLFATVQLVRESMLSFQVLRDHAEDIERDHA